MRRASCGPTYLEGVEFAATACRHARTVSILWGADPRQVARALVTASREAV
jgi:hypothetical protein